MEKEEFRAVIKHFHLKKSKAAQIKAKLEWRHYTNVEDRFIGWESDGHCFFGLLKES